MPLSASTLTSSRDVQFVGFADVWASRLLSHELFGIYSESIHSSLHSSYGVHDTIVRRPAPPTGAAGVGQRLWRRIILPSLQRLIDEVQFHADTARTNGTMAPLRNFK